MNDEALRVSLEGLKSRDRQEQGRAFNDLLAATSARVDWAYLVWDDLRADLTHPDNHRRAIAAQLLCNLAQSDPDARIVEEFPLLLELTSDERFVTARHCLQSLWKVGLAGQTQKDVLLEGLARRYAGCAAEKNCTLIRYDILQGLRRLHDSQPDPAVKALALELIAAEPDLKYRKKYSSLWRD